jgi:hypothetical protein
MTQINRQLTVWQGPNDVQLHLTDPYGNVNGVVSLSLEECQQLVEALAALQPIAVIDVEAVVTEDAESKPDTDWAALTKAEILEEVKDRFGVLLDDTLKKDALIAKAVQLEAEHDA